MNTTIPWQLQLFQRTLKKKLRLKELKKYLSKIPHYKQCLLVTCGDNNGALNYFLRELGGEWSWAELESNCLAEMSELLGNKVELVQSDKIPFSKGSFDYVIAVDVHEHLDDPETFTKELSRVTKVNGKLIFSTPVGNERRLVNKLKLIIGMSNEVYGHKRTGHDTADLANQMGLANIDRSRETTFSKFFTELAELFINVVYVKVLSTRNSSNENERTISPYTKEQIKSVLKTYRLYSFIYPLVWMFSSLDVLLPFSAGYSVMVEGIKRKN